MGGGGERERRERGRVGEIGRKKRHENMCRERNIKKRAIEEERKIDR